MFLARFRRKLRRVLVITSVVLLLLVITATFTARFFFHGPRLARFITGLINEGIRGRVEVESVEWPLSDLPKLMTGGNFHVTVRGAKVYDEFGNVVISTDLVTADVDIQAITIKPLFSKRRELLLDNIEIPNGGYALIKEVVSGDNRAFQVAAVSLISAFEPKFSEGFFAGVSATPPAVAVFDLKHYRVRNVDMDFQYPRLNWSANAKGISGEGFLRFDGRDPLAQVLYYSLAPTATGGMFSWRTEAGGSEGFDIPLSSLHVPHLRQLPSKWPNETMPEFFEYAAVAQTPEGAKITGSGQLSQELLEFDDSTHNLSAKVENAGGLLDRLTNHIVDGANASISIDISGPTMAQTFGLVVDGVNVHGKDRTTTPSFEVGRLAANWDYATRSGELKPTKVSGAGGEISLASKFQMQPFAVDATVAIEKPLQLSKIVPKPWLASLPPPLRRALGEDVRGHISAVASLQKQQLRDISISLGDFALKGSVEREAGHGVNTKNLRLALGKTEVSDITGKLYDDDKSVDLQFRLSSQDLAMWMKRFNLPVFATQVQGRGAVRGRFDDLSGNADIAVLGIPLVKSAQAKLRLAQSRKLLIEDLDTFLWGGWVHGTATLDLVRKEVSQSSVEAINLQLSRIPAVGRLLQGELDVAGGFSGKFSQLTGQVTGKAQNLVIAQDGYKDSEISAKLSSNGTWSLDWQLLRRLGGELAVSGSLNRQQEIEGTLKANQWPLEVFALLVSDPAKFGGWFSADVKMLGTLKEPMLDGTLAVHQAWANGMGLGSPTIRVQPAGDGRILVRAELAQGAIVAKALVSPTNPQDSELLLDLRRVDIDPFFPELFAAYHAQAWVSGQISIKNQPGQGSGEFHPVVNATLSELVISLNAENLDGRPVQLKINNASPVDLVVRDQKISLLHDVTFTHPAGSFVISGEGDQSGVKLTMRAALDLRQLVPFARTYVEQMTGKIDAVLAVSGDMRNPLLSGVVEFGNVKIQPVGQETFWQIPMGKVELKDNEVSVTALTIAVSDQFSSEKAELKVAGGLRLKHWLPSVWGLQVEGQLAGKMLTTFAPQIFSSGSGLAQLSLRLKGQGKVPEIDGQIEFGGTHPLLFSPRGVQREIVLTGGIVSFSDTNVSIDHIVGSIDDEGTIDDISGEIGLNSNSLQDLDISLSASDVPFRIPQKMDASFNLRNFWIVADRDSKQGYRVEIGGQGGRPARVEIVTGRFTQNYNLVVDTLRPVRTVEESPPFWETTPWLANASLDVEISTDAFFVDNNLAKIQLEGQVSLTGSPRNPHFGGEINVAQGAFRIPGFKAKFSRMNGGMDFVTRLRFPSQTPKIDVISEADLRDTTGINHVITLFVRGTTDDLRFDLSTNTGLSRADAIQLALTGKNPQVFRQSLGETVIGSKQPGNIVDPSLNDGAGALGIADQFAKDLAGDLFATLLGSRLEEVLQLDVFRVLVGSSLGVHAEKNLFPAFKLVGDYEYAPQGNSVSGRAEYRVNDSWSLNAETQQKNFNDPSTADVSTGRVKVTWRRILLP